MKLSRCNVLILGGVMAAVLAASGPTRAADTGAGDTTSKRVAELFKKANALYDDKKLPEAEALYLEAWNLKKTYDVACNLGAIELDRGKPRDAAEHLAYALREFPAGGKSSARDVIESRFKKAREQVGALRIRVNIAGARVVVGTRAIGISPISDDVFVDPGSVAIQATLSGYEPVKQTINVTQGGATEVSLTLEGGGRSRVPAFIMGGVGLVALGGGLSFIGIAESKKSEAQDLAVETKRSCAVSDPAPQGKCKDLASAASGADTFGNVGIGGLVVAGVAAAGVATYLLWPSPRGDAATARGVRAIPVATTNGGGLFVSGSF